MSAINRSPVAGLPHRRIAATRQLRTTYGTVNRCLFFRRRETKAVADSYQGLARAARDERWLAYAAYVTALDSEERAACEYRRLIEQADGR
jgi:hypothetical protein